MKRRILALLLTAVMALSLAACGSTAEDYAGQTLTGQVTAIDGSAVALWLGIPALRSYRVFRGT